MYSVATLGLIFTYISLKQDFCVIKCPKFASGARATSHFGFTKVTWNGRDCAQYLYCSVVMSSASLGPSKLKNHRDKKHPQRKNDDIDALSSKTVRYDLEATLLYLEFMIEENPTLQCSYEVAYVAVVYPTPSEG